MEKRWCAGWLELRVVLRKVRFGETGAGFLDLVCRWRDEDVRVIDQNGTVGVSFD